MLPLRTPSAPAKCSLARDGRTRALRGTDTSNISKMFYTALSQNGGPPKWVGVLLKPSDSWGSNLAKDNPTLRTRQETRVPHLAHPRGKKELVKTEAYKPKTRECETSKDNMVTLTKCDHGPIVAQRPTGFPVSKPFDSC